MAVVGVATLAGANGLDVDALQLRTPELGLRRSHVARDALCAGRIVDGYQALPAFPPQHQRLSVNANAECSATEAALHMQTAMCRCWV